MNPDKYLTDLAAFTGCDSIKIDWRGYFGAPDRRFEVTLAKLDANEPNGWAMFYDEGSTVEIATANARAKMLAHYEVAA